METRLRRSNPCRQSNRIWYSLVMESTQAKYDAIRRRSALHGMVAYNKTVNLTPSPLLASKVRFAGTACCAAGYESRYMLHAVHDPAQV